MADVADPATILARYAPVLHRAAPHTFAPWRSGGAWKPYPHLCHIGERIALAVARGGGRLLVNMGPRTGKSELISFETPVWFLDNFPERRVILATNTADLARKYGGRVRDEFNTNPKLTTRLKEDTKAKDDFATPEGGAMKTVGVGGALMGRGADLLIVDDPYGSWEDGWSPAYRRMVQDWFDGTAMSRLEPGATVIVLHHRMHPKDLTSHILSGETARQWEHICLPSLAMENDPIGRKPGEAIVPERYSADFLRTELKRSRQMNEALHQQNPSEVGPGAAYEHYSAENVGRDVELRPDLPLDFAVDFNRTPSMTLLLGQHDPEADVLTDVWELTESRSVVAMMGEFEAWMKARGGFRWPRLRVFGDASGGTKSTQTGHSDYAIIRRRLEAMGLAERIDWRVPRANPPIGDRVNAMNDALWSDGDGLRHYRIHERCTRLIRDLREQQRDEDGFLDETDKTLGHAGAAAGYRVHRLRPLRSGLAAMPQRQGRFSV